MMKILPLKIKLLISVFMMLHWLLELIKKALPLNSLLSQKDFSCSLWLQETSTLNNCPHIWFLINSLFLSKTRSLHWVSFHMIISVLNAIISLLSYNSPPKMLKFWISLSLLKLRDPIKAPYRLHLTMKTHSNTSWIPINWLLVSKSILMLKMLVQKTTSQSMLLSLLDQTSILISNFQSPSNPHLMIKWWQWSTMPILAKSPKTQPSWHLTPSRMVELEWLLPVTRSGMLIMMTLRAQIWTKAKAKFLNWLMKCGMLLIFQGQGR